MSVSLLILAAATASPSPAPSPKCIDRDPSIVHVAEPVYPDIARQQGATGTTIVSVDLDSNGVPVRVVVFKSSGNAALDQATVKAAQQTTYAAAVSRCRAVASRYLFNADFAGSR